jgi:aminopeptidase N
MVRQILYPATRLPIVLNQMMEESNQNLINAVYMSLVQAQQVYLPPENIQKFNKESADFFLRKAKKEKNDTRLQMFCLDKAFGFMFDEENLILTEGWLKTGEVMIDGEKLDTTLTADQKYAVIKSFFASPHFDTDRKKALKELVFADDESDKGKKVALGCDLSMPDAEQKERLWAQITDIESQDTLQLAEIKMQGFFQRNQQLDLLVPYFAKYFDVLGEVVEKRDREFAERFMKIFSPAFMARDEDEKAFRDYLRNPAFAERNFFVLFLKE